MQHCASCMHEQWICMFCPHAGRTNRTVSGANTKVQTELLGLMRLWSCWTVSPTGLVQRPPAASFTTQPQHLRTSWAEQLLASCPQTYQRVHLTALMKHLLLRLRTDRIWQRTMQSSVYYRHGCPVRISVFTYWSLAVSTENLQEMSLLTDYCLTNMLQWSVCHGQRWQSTDFL